jgi:hypothetical protein
MMAVKFGGLAETFQAAEDGSARDPEFLAARHDRFVERFTLIEVRLTQMQA